MGVAGPPYLTVSLSLPLLLCSSQTLKHCLPDLSDSLSPSPVSPAHSPFFLLSSTRDGGKNLGEGKARKPKSEASSPQSSPFPRLAPQKPGKRTKPPGNKGCIPTCQRPTAAAPGCSGNELILLLAVIGILGGAHGCEVDCLDSEDPIRDLASLPPAV